MKKTLNLSFLMLLCVLLLSCTIKRDFFQTMRSQKDICSGNKREREYCLKTNFNLYTDLSTQEVFQIIDKNLGVQNRTIDEENEIYINKLIGESYLLDGKSCRIGVSMHVNRKNDRDVSLKFTNFRRKVVPKEESDKKVLDSEGNVFIPDKEGELKEVSIGSSCLEIDEDGVVQLNSRFKNLINLISQDLIRSSLPKGVEKPVETVNKTQGVLLQRRVMVKWGWFKKEDLWPDSHSYPKGDKDRKYEGEIENGKPNGMGTLTFLSGKNYVGEFKQGTFWNVTCLDIDENICGRWLDGVEQ